MGFGSTPFPGATCDATDGISAYCERIFQSGWVRTMTLEDRRDPPTFASKGADRWTRRNVERNGADAWASLTNIEVDVFLGRSPGFIVLRRAKSLSADTMYQIGSCRTILDPQLECTTIAIIPLAYHLYIAVSFDEIVIH